MRKRFIEIPTGTRRLVLIDNISEVRMLDGGKIAIYLLGSPDDKIDLEGDAAAKVLKALTRAAIQTRD